MTFVPEQPAQILSRTDTLENWTAADPIPGAGEICIEWVNDVTIADVKVKIGTGFHHYTDLPYWSSGGGSFGTIGAGTILGNNAASAGSVLELSTAQVMSMLGAVGQSAFDDLTTAVTGHQAIGLTTAYSVTATSVNGQPTVTTSGGATFPAQFVASVPISGPGIPAHTYVGVRNSNTSIGLSSSPSSNTPVNAGAGAGTGTFTIRDTLAFVHGLWPALVLQQNPINYEIAGHSTPNGLSTFPINADEWKIRWKDGEAWYRSYEYDQANAGAATWVKLFPPDIFTPEYNVLIVPAAANNTTWTPTNGDPFGFGSAPARFYRAIPFNGATQAKLNVDWLITAPTGASSVKLKLQYATDMTGATWLDLAENSPASTIEVDITSGTGPKIGTYGNIDNAAITAAATNGGQLLIRIVAVVTGTVSNTPAYGQISAWFK